MLVVHVHIHGLEDGNLYQGIYPRAIEQTGDIDGDGTRIEGEQIGVFH